MWRILTRTILLAIVVAGIARIAMGTSTINPNYPGTGASITSLGLRTQFGSAYGDVNNIENMFAATSPPGNALTYQLWANTSTSPPTVEIYDGAQWVAIGTLNSGSHAWSFALPATLAIGNGGNGEIDIGPGSSTNGVLTLGGTAGSGTISVGGNAGGGTVTIGGNGAAGTLYVGYPTSGTGTLTISGDGAQATVDNANGSGATAHLPTTGGVLASNAGTGIGLTAAGTVSAHGVEHLAWQPGLLSSVGSTKGGFAQIGPASTVDNIIASASAFTCSGNPTVTMYECGTSTTCASPTTIGSATVSASGTAVSGTISSAAITAGDFIAWELSAGTCTSLDIAVVAQVHAN